MPLTASADPPSAAPTEDALVDARRLFLEAVEAQETGRYRDALALYHRVSLVTMTPTLLFNIGTCREQLGDLIEAEAAFERALAEATARGNAEVEAEARTRLKALHEDIPRLVVRLPPAAEDAAVVLDDARVATSELRVNPGTHRLVVSSERHTRVFAMTVELPARSSRSIDVDLGPPRSEPAPRIVERTVSPRPGKSYTPALIAGAGALALGGGALATGLIGHDQLGRFEELNATPEADNRAERERLRSSGQAMQVANTVLIGTAVLAAGIAIYFLVRPPATSARRASASSLTTF